MRKEKNLVVATFAPRLYTRPSYFTISSFLIFASGCNTLQSIADKAPLPRPPVVSQVDGETREWSNASGVFYSPNIHYVIDVTLGFGNSLEVSSDGTTVPRIGLNEPVMDSTEPPENTLVARNGVYRARELENDIDTKRQVLRLEFYPRTWPQWRSNQEIAHARPFDLTLVERSINPQVANTSAALGTPTRILLMTWRTPCVLSPPQFSPNPPRVREPVTITYSAINCKSVSATSTSGYSKESIGLGPDQNFSDQFGWSSGFNGETLRVVIDGMNAAGISAPQIQSGIQTFDPPPAP